MANEKRLIDANALMDKAYWHGEHHTYDCFYPEGSGAVDVDDIEDAPTVDAVEVVRCKDCKRRYFNEYIEEYCCEQWGDGFDTVCTDDDFCSRGERKDNG